MLVLMEAHQPCKLKERIRVPYTPPFKSINNNMRNFDKEYSRLIKEAVNFDPEMVKAANSTSRTLGAVGAKAVVPRVVEKIAAPGQEILDFGAGKDAAHALRLRDQNGLNVVAYDFGSNISDIHDPNALSKQYDIIYASNVLNVQGSEEMLNNTLQQIRNSLKQGGTFVYNLPKTPRYGAYTDKPPREQDQFLVDRVNEIFGGQTVRLNKLIGSGTPVYGTTI